MIVLIIFILVPEEVLPAFLDEEWDQYKAATGSAHHQASRTLKPSPTRIAKSWRSQEQAFDCLSSQRRDCIRAATRIFAT